MTRDVNGAGLSETQWRLLWEERLDGPARRRIRRSALRGEALDDADEAVVAMEFARRRRRGARSVAIFNELIHFVLLGARPSWPVQSLGRTGE